MNETVWTIKALLDWTAGYFAERDAEQPRLDAEVLLAEALDCERIELYTRFDEVVGDADRAKFRDWVRRHAEGEPVAYLVGHKEFFSLEFEVNSHVLIPRPETEHLVSNTLDLIKEFYADQSKVRIVDVGTGSGCIAIAIAKHSNKVQVDAIDISENAIAIAQQNVEKHGVQESVQLRVGDLLDGVDDPRSIDIVVSNPPYIGESEKSELSPSVRDFEPESALFAGDEQGLVTSVRLIDQVRDLTPGTFLLMESSPMNIGQVKQAVDQSGFAFCEIKKDLAGLERWIVARKANEEAGRS